MVASCEDKPRAANSRQCIQIDDPIWQTAHSDLTAAEYEASMSMVDDYGRHIMCGVLEGWETSSAATKAIRATWSSRFVTLKREPSFDDRRIISSQSVPMRELPWTYRSLTTDDGLLSRCCWRLVVEGAAAQIIGAAGTKGKAFDLR